MIEENVKKFFSFINERHAIHCRLCVKKNYEDIFQLHVPEGFKIESLPAVADDLPQYNEITNDEVFGKYKFTNVFRELDRVTIAIRKLIREPFENDPYLWWMLCASRWINRESTLKFLIDVGSWPNKFSEKDKHLFLRAFSTDLENYAERGNTVYGNAYMLRAESDKTKPWYSYSKHRFIGEVVLGQLWEKGEEWSKFFETVTTLQEAHKALTTQYSWGHFMAYEVITDLRHTRYLKDAEDIFTWANAGPGAMRGLNRIYERDLNKRLKPQQSNPEMKLLLDSSPEFLAPWVPSLEMRDIEHCLCEYDKYERAKDTATKSRPKQRYRGWK